MIHLSLDTTRYSRLCLVLVAVNILNFSQILTRLFKAVQVLRGVQCVNVVGVIWLSGSVI